MLETVITELLWLAGVYAALGVAALIPLQFRGLGTFDHGAVGAPFLFRLLVTPGLVALWPVVLLRWRAAARGAHLERDPDRPLPARTLRRLHGAAIRLLAVFLPVIMAVAILSRTPGPAAASAPYAEMPPPYETVAQERANAFDGLPIVVRVREDGAGHAQVELDIAADLRSPALAAYWLPEGADPGPRAGAYLGAVWGPTTLRYALPAEAYHQRGVVLLYSFADAAVVAKATIGEG